MLIFDTSAAIEWLKGNEKLKNKIENIDIPAFKWHISVITVYELLWAAEKKGKTHVDAVERFIEKPSKSLKKFFDKILYYTLEEKRETHHLKL